MVFRKIFKSEKGKSLKVELIIRTCDLKAESKLLRQVNNRDYDTSCL